MTGGPTEPVGTFCLVLHTHLPWLAHHGAWPVGEEWLHQSWAMSYLPVTRVLRRLAAEGHRNLVTLGVTPVVAAQLDDPYLLTAQDTWLHDWYVRAQGMTADRDPDRRAMGRWEAGNAHRAIEEFSTTWRSGGSPVLRELADSGTVELLGGPLTHPFQPLLDPEIAAFALHAGRHDARLRLGSVAGGLWAPECGYRPGLETLYQNAGVSHFMLDGPTLKHVGAGTHIGHRIGDSDVIAFGRDLDVSYRVWSPRRGYPGGRWYRDFHTFDHDWGVRQRRVTGRNVAPQDKAQYDPAAALAATRSDAEDFVETIRERLLEIVRRHGEPGLTIAAYDTELFGHWWYEGPQWLEHVLRLLPAAGVRVTTLRGAIDHGLVDPRPAYPQSGSWGAGKDWHVWDGDVVHGMVADNNGAQMRVLQALKEMPLHDGRFPVADQLVRNLMLALSSDWAFMVSHGSAAQYARSRHDQHHWAVAELAELVAATGWRSAEATDLAARQRANDGVFGHLDARELAR